MPMSKEERDRILCMIEAGHVSAIEASQLLDTLEEKEQTHTVERLRNRTVRVCTTHTNSRSQKVHMTASLPVSLLKVGLHLSSRLLPQLNPGTVEDLLYSIEQGKSGRLLDVQDLDQGERLEIFVE